MPVSILDARTQEKDWNDILRKVDCADAYFTPGYSLSFDGVDDGVPLLFVFENRQGVFLYPFRERELAALPGLEAFAGRRDIASTYGYGGPLAVVRRPEDREAFIDAALDAFDERCRERGIVSEFCRFHPLRNNASDVRERYEPVLLNQTVWIDLDRPEAEIMSDMRPNYRRDIRKALKDGLVVRRGRDRDMVKRLSALYTQSMRDVGASSQYFFDQDFFLRLMRLHAETALLYIAFKEGAPLAGALYIWGGSDAHYHFGGMDRTRGEMHASKLVQYAAVMDCRRRGLKRVHLGGGYGGSDNDSLMCFKSGFSPLRASYHVSRRIHDEAAFLKACAAVGVNPEKTAYFPAYRATSLDQWSEAQRSAVGDG